MNNQTVSLSKGERVSLSKSVNIFTVGLSWDASQVHGEEFDLDVMAFMLNKDGKVITHRHFVFYNNLEDPEKSLRHSGDNLTGEGAGDDEQMVLDLSKVHDGVTEIKFIMNIHEGIARNQNFGQVRNSVAKLYEGDASANPSLPAALRYDLEEDASSSTNMEFCTIYKHNDGWKFRALGQGNKLTLSQNIKQYGVEAAENNI